MRPRGAHFGKRCSVNNDVLPPTSIINIIFKFATQPCFLVNHFLTQCSVLMRTFQPPSTSLRWFLTRALMLILNLSPQEQPACAMGREITVLCLRAKIVSKILLVYNRKSNFERNKCYCRDVNFDIITSTAASTF